MKNLLYILLFIPIGFAFGQNPEWVKNIGGNGFEGTGNQLAKDATGNVYMVGQFTGTANFGGTNQFTASNADAFIAKYTAAGDLIKVTVISGSGDDNCADIDIDGSGNVYVTGHYTGSVGFPGWTPSQSDGFESSPDAYIAKFDSNLNFQSVITYHGAGEESGSALDIDNSGNIYVTGYFTETTSFGGQIVQSKVPGGNIRDVWVTKITSGFSFQYVKTFGGDEQDSPTSLKVSGSFIYLAGRFLSSNLTDDTFSFSLATKGSSDIYLGKFQDFGTFAQTKYFVSFGGSDYETPQDMAFEEAGGNYFVYVVGRTNDKVTFNPANSDEIPSNRKAAFISKYRDTGSGFEYVFAKSYGGESGGSDNLTTDRAMAVTLGQNNNIYVSGEYYRDKILFEGGGKKVELKNSNSKNDGGSADLFVMEFDKSNGNPVTGYSVNGPETENSVDILLAAQNVVYLTGSFKNEVTFGSGEVVKPNASSITEAFLAKVGGKATGTDFTTQLSPALNGYLESKAEWIDFDNDGLLDLVMVAYVEDTDDKILFYRNTGSGYALVHNEIIDSESSFVIHPADFNKDGFVDIMVDGYVYLNQKNNKFQPQSRITAGFISFTSLADYNNDGLTDVLLTTLDAENDYEVPLVRLFKNQDGVNFVKDNQLSVEPIFGSHISWADYDNDGDMDFIISGHTNFGDNLIELYNNTNGTFTKSPHTFASLSKSATAWGDLDNDGDLDLLLSGEGGNYLYINNLGSSNFTVSDFIAIADENLTIKGPFQLADYDNDGDLDVLHYNLQESPGRFEIFSNKISGNSVKLTSEFTFEDVGNSLNGVGWTDLKNDNKLDYVVSTSKITNQLISYANTGNKKNSKPNAPSGLSFSLDPSDVTGKTVILTWNQASDKETPKNGLSYNLRLGTSAGGRQIISPLALTSGKTTADNLLGNADQSLSWKVILPAYGDYFWSVQAVDQNFTGSAFVKEESFTLVNPSTPEITALEPAIGTVGSEVVIKGKNFGTDANVITLQFGKGNLSAFTLVDANTITFNVPDSLTGNYGVKVLVNELSSNVATFTIIDETVPSPTIQAFNADTVTTGSPLTIAGENFGESQELVQVFFTLNGSVVDSVADFTSFSNQNIALTAPELKTGKYGVYLKVNGMESPPKDLTIISVPTLVSIEPNFILEGTSQQLTVTGSKFGTEKNEVSLTFTNTTDASLISTLSPDSLLSQELMTLNSPDLPVGDYTVKLTVNGIKAVEEISFQVIAEDDPALTTLSRLEGLPGEELVLRGSNFGEDANAGVVNFYQEGGIVTTVESFQSFTDSTISILIPELAFGNYEIGVSFDTISTNLLPFTVPDTSTQTPMIQAINPDSVVEQTALPVTITGKFLDMLTGTLSVTFTKGDSVAVAPANLSDTTIQLTTPMLTVGLYNIQVKADNVPVAGEVDFKVFVNTDTTTTPVDSLPTVTNPPTEIDPNDTSLVFNGANFGENPMVFIVSENDSVPADIISQTDTQIEIKVPETLESDDYTIWVVTAAGRTQFNIQYNSTDTTPPLTTNLSEETFSDGSSVVLTFKIEDDDTTNLTGTLFARGIRDVGDFVPISQSEESTGEFSYNVPEEIYSDELGIEYFMIAQDQTGNADTTTVSRTYKDYANSNKSFVLKVNEVKNAEEPLATDYNLLSVPFTGFNIQNVFDSLGDFGKDKDWMLYAWDNSGNYQSVSSGTIDPKKAYMLIFRNASAETVIEAKGAVIHVEDATVRLDTGWNIVGNPFPFDLDWDQIAAANQLSEEFKFKKFTNGSFSEGSSTIPMLTGAAIFNPNQPVDIQIPYKNTENGRIKGNKDIDKISTLDASSWQVPILVSSENLSIRGAIGMHEEAAMSYDKFDDVAPPRFIKYLEMNFLHPEFFYSKFAADIVPTQPGFSWVFEIATNEHDQQISLTWDNNGFGLNDLQLLLVDQENDRIIDMRAVNNYSFVASNEPQKFKIYFGDSQTLRETMMPDHLFVGIPYPNPMTDQLFIPISLPEGSSSYSVEISVYNLSGQLVRKIDNNLSKGYQLVQWDRKNQENNNVPAGLYFFRVNVNHQNLLNNGKILVH